MTAPRGPLANADRRVAVAIGLGQGGGEADDIEAAIRAGHLGRHEALEEQVAERLVVAVELAVARDDDQRRPGAVRVTGGRRAHPGHDPFAREPIRVGGRGGLERDRARQVAVVERDRDVTPVADVDAVRAARVERRDVRLPRGEDGGPDAGLGEGAQGGHIDGRLGQPHRRRPPTEADLEVACAPHDLCAPVVGGRQRQDRVVERLCDARAASFAIGGREARKDLGGVRREVPRQRGSHVPRDMRGRAALGDRPIALVGDAGAPVPVRGGRRVLRHPAGERILAQRLVEVSMDDEPAAPHGRWFATGLTRVPRPRRRPGRAQRAPPGARRTAASRPARAGPATR